jgi:hypothetical protein
MQISELTYRGDTYAFEPPVNVGTHQVDSMSKLVAIAIGGASRPAGIIEIATQQPEVVLGYLNDSSSVLTCLNSMLNGRHSVAIK